MCARNSSRVYTAVRLGADVQHDGPIPTTNHRIEILYADARDS